MKALGILKGSLDELLAYRRAGVLSNGGAVWLDEITEAIAELEEMERNTAALQSTIQEQEKQINEYAGMLHEASKPKTCDNCEFLMEDADCYMFVYNHEHCKRYGKDYFTPAKARDE